MQQKVFFIKEQIQIIEEDPKSLWKVLNRFQSVGISKVIESILGLNIDGKDAIYI